MDNCKKYQSMMEKALYDELPSSQNNEFLQHINNCNCCASEFYELRNIIDAVSGVDRPEPTESYLNNLWNTIQPKLVKEKTSSLYVLIIEKIKELFIIHRSLPYQLAGGIALIMLGIFIGRFYMTDETAKIIPEFRTDNNIVISPENNIQPEQQTDAATGEIVVKQAAYRDEAQKFVDKSKILLLGLVNFDPGSDDIDVINLPKQKEISRELVSRVADLKNKLNKPSQQQLRDLITDLEVILLQIANLESEYNLEGIDLVKDGVNKKGIFLKININEMQKAKKIKSGNRKEKNEKMI